MISYIYRHGSELTRKLYDFFALIYQELWPEYEQWNTQVLKLFDSNAYRNCSNIFFFFHFHDTSRA